MVNNSNLIKIPTFKDHRGCLSVVDTLQKTIPFQIDRVFWLHSLPDSAQRGSHAHRTSWELVIAVSGKVRISLEEIDGCRNVYFLDEPDLGLLVPPCTWCELEYFSHDAVCLCLASECYNSDAYINSYMDFSKIKKLI